MGFGWFVVLFVVSCLFRYFLEVLSNVIISSFKQKTDWDFIWKQYKCDSDEGAAGVVCNALKICISDVVPELIPVSADDIWIQALLIIIILLVADKLADGDALKRE